MPLASVDRLPQESGALEKTASGGAWTTVSSADFTDLSTGVPVGSDKRLCQIVVVNLSSVQARFTYGQTAAIVTGLPIADAAVIPPKSEAVYDTYSLGKAQGVVFIGLRPDEVTLSSSALGTGVSGTTLRITARFLDQPT